MSLNKRLTVLETTASPPLSASVRRWLGESLTDAEHARADKEMAEMAGAASADPASFPAEMRAWLDR